MVINGELVSLPSPTYNSEVEDEKKLVIDREITYGFGKLKLLRVGNSSAKATKKARIS